MWTTDCCYNFLDVGSTARLLVSGGNVNNTVEVTYMGEDGTTLVCPPTPVNANSCTSVAIPLTDPIFGGIPYRGAVRVRSLTACSFIAYSILTTSADLDLVSGASFRGQTFRIPMAPGVSRVRTVVTNLPGQGPISVTLCQVMAGGYSTTVPVGANCTWIWDSQPNLPAGWTGQLEITASNNVVVSVTTNMLLGQMHTHMPAIQVV